MKKIHLICNAHLDTVWQWEWEEGAAAAISTFRVAADFCEQYEDFVFCHNEAILYRWVEEYEPALFERIVKLVKDGKWHIMGGWHLQPDCNMPSGEGFVRQALEGRRYFEEKFQKRPTTAINFDPFGHTRGLVQIMAKSGYDSYIFCRPGSNDCTLPAEAFNWIGYDGSSVMGCRVAAGYNSGLGNSINKIKPVIEKCKENNIDICLWGVGNHGGGPSKIDLDAIHELQAEMKEKNIKITHSTPEAYFSELKTKGNLPDYAKDLNTWAPGCYTSQIRIKQKYRLLENMLFMTEKMCSSAELSDKMEYPQEELKEAEYDLLTIQFHDALPGSSIQPVEEMSIRTLDHGLEILSRVRTRAFFALSSGQKKANSDEIPILVFNPYPYEVDGVFESEFMLWDQNWKIEFSYPEIYYNGEKIPSQPEKEMSNIPLDWRKRVVFAAKLPPMQMVRFDCKFKTLPSKPIPNLPQTADFYTFDNGSMQVKINKETGLIDSFKVSEKEFFETGALTLDVMSDNVDPWGMCDTYWKDKIGQFLLLSPEEGTHFSNIENVISSIRVIEDGSVRTVVETILGYNTSRAVVRYLLNKNSNSFDIEIRILWNEKAKMVKLAIPTAFKNPEFSGEVAYGIEAFPTNGKEVCAHKYLLMSEKNSSIALVNNGVYGASCENNILKQTLLRSASYTAHPLGERKILPQDRFTPYIEQGERLYKFSVFAGNKDEIENNIARTANLINEVPMTLSFFPQGNGIKSSAPIELLGSSAIEMNVLKKSENKNGYIVRLFNTKSTCEKSIINCKSLEIEFEHTLNPFEILTLRIEKGKVTLCDLTEKSL